MISESTKKAVMALVEIDGGVTQDERNAICDVLKHGTTAKETRVVSFADVARRIGKSKVTVFEFVKRGKLKAVMGAGGRNIGVSEKSLDDLIMGNNTKE